jgi:GT2 family glycosyltransferase
VEAETPLIDVGVVVVTYNSAPVLSRLLDSLSAGLSGLHWRAVVVDNASSDSTVNIAEGGGIEVIRRQENGGYAAAINDGSRRFANARSILVLNPDCELTPWSMQKLLDELDADPTVGIAAPKTVLKNGTTLDPTLRREPSVLRTWAAIVLGGPLARRYAWASDAVVDPKRYETVQDADWVVGAVLLISRRCIDAIGDWDESFFLYSEEVDYCRRARQAGFAVRYTPAAVTLHEGGEGA